MLEKYSSELSPGKMSILNTAKYPTTPTELVQLIQTLATKRTTATAAMTELVKLAPEIVEPLIAAFHICSDQGVQAYIVQALAQIGDARALDLLIEVVGVEVANHCQGNVRRVAARGLGRIGSKCSHDRLQQVVEKLTWALCHAEDWALRYAAVVSLQEIATTEAIAVLQQALIPEPDPVVQLRIQTAIANLNLYPAEI